MVFEQLAPMPFLGIIVLVMAWFATGADCAAQVTTQFETTQTQLNQIPILLHREINRSIKQNAIVDPQSVFAHLGFHRSGVPDIILEEDATM